MKRLLKTLTLIFVMLCSLTSCLGFFEEEMLQIQGIETMVLDDGGIRVTITYTDDSIAPTVFDVPKGNTGPTGATGNGISGVVTTPTEDGKGTIVTITYTDDEMEPTIITLSNGVSVVGMESSVIEETGDKEIVFIFSDETRSEPIIIPAGKDGVSITSLTSTTNEDDSVTIEITLSNSEEPIKVEIPAPKEGRGIESIVSMQSEDKYILQITYTDGETQDLEFDRPNKWFSETTTPTSEDGIDGDMWYDKIHNVIYTKEDGEWIRLLGLEKTCIVRFNVNDDDEYADIEATIPGGRVTYRIESGNCFASGSNDKIPVPTRPGFIFKGWYTVTNPTIVNGMFTDLTIVTNDIILYASWEKIE